MSSQRLRVLDFVRRYIGRWGHSPSHGEIGAGLDIDRSCVRRAIKSLVRSGLLIQQPGARGLAIPDAEADALRQLRALGWTINPSEEVIAKATLLPPAALDYVPPSGEAIDHGGTPDARADED